MPIKNVITNEWEISYGDTLDSFNTSGEMGIIIKSLKKRMLMVMLF